MDVSQLGVSYTVSGDNENTSAPQDENVATIAEHVDLFLSLPKLGLGTPYK